MSGYRGDGNPLGKTKNMRGFVFLLAPSFGFLMLDEQPNGFYWTALTT